MKQDSLLRIKMWFSILGLSGDFCENTVSVSGAGSRHLQYQGLQEILMQEVELLVVSGNYQAVMCIRIIWRDFINTDS